MAAVSSRASVSPLETVSFNSLGVVCSFIKAVDHFNLYSTSKRLARTARNPQTWTSLVGVSLPSPLPSPRGRMPRLQVQRRSM